MLSFALARNLCFQEYLLIPFIWSLAQPGKSPEADADSVVVPRNLKMSRTTAIKFITAKTTPIVVIGKG
jgi:hypothetical protein